MNICGDCLRFMGCSWEREFKPVDGWKAEKTKLYISKDVKIDTYKISYCPLFIPPNRPVQDGVPDGLVARNIKTGKVKHYASVREAEKDGFNAKSIYTVLRGENKTHKGWTFYRTSAKEVQAKKNRGTPIVGVHIQTGKKIQFPSMKAAEKEGFYVQCIRKCLNKQQSSHMDYKWYYEGNEPK